MKRALSLIVVLLVAIVAANLVYAAELSDSVFDHAGAVLLTNKVASFEAETFSTASSIEVSEVKLYKMVGSTWVYQKTLNAPSYVATNSMLYDFSVNYSSEIGTGTYRLWVKFVADGHSITRYSNQRTY